MKCHYIYDEQAGKVLIPGCWGTAIYGIDKCNCTRVPETDKQWEKKEFNEKSKEQIRTINELEKQNAELNRVIKNLLRKPKNVSQ